jgi:polyhydroxyalkanoate synthesis regulator phasin
MKDNKKNLAKSFNMIDNSMEKMWDMWLVSLGSLSSTQEQIEDMTRKQLDQNKAAREEMLKLVEDLSKQMRRNQEQFQKIVEETVMNTYEHINYTNQSLIGDLSKKVDDLAKKHALLTPAAFVTSQAV